MKAEIKRYPIYRKKRFWAGILLAQFLLFYVASKIDFAIAFFEMFFELQKKWHQQLFASFPFSVGDVFYILVISFLIYLVIQLVKKKDRNRQWIKSLMLLNIFYLTYQVFWGMLYFQKPLRDQLPEKEIEISQMKTLTLKYLNSCKESRLLVREDVNGVFDINNLDAIKKEILQKQNKLPTFINVKKSPEINSMKPSLFKGIMSYTGILGYYNPFTAEAQYNADLPATYIPFTLSHESAHQLGYAREQEANFIGYLVGKDSKNADLKYSTQYFVLKSLLSSLSETDADFVKHVLSNFSAGMHRDRKAEKDFVKKHEGLLEVFFGYTNDLFLKSNQQEGSITYSYFIDLLLRYESTPHLK